MGRRHWRSEIRNWHAPAIGYVYYRRTLRSHFHPRSVASAAFPMASERKRIVLKFGSGILATPKGTALDLRQFSRLTKEVAALVAAGPEVLVVSSGAVAAGLGALGLGERPCEI